MHTAGSMQIAGCMVRVRVSLNISCTFHYVSHRNSKEQYKLIVWLG